MSEVYNGCDTTEYIAVPGPQGPQGQRGAQGLQGVPGPMGPQGEPGAVGPQGCQGPKGDRGPRGEKGDKGEPGTPGARGPEGPEGPRGCNGKNGQDGTVLFEELTPLQIEMLRGEQGPVGPKGPRGDIGPRGPQGATGSQGPQGPAGANGPQGPKGNDGPPGPQGPVGLRGPQGEPGENGISHDDHIGENSTWNSKTIVDYALHGKVRWEEHSLYQSNIANTANGFAKDLVVHGKTMINYINQENFRNEFNSTEEQEARQHEGWTVYAKTPNKPEVHGRNDQGEGVYTLIYNMEIVSAGAGLHEGDHVQITVNDPSNGKTTYGPTIQEGLNKLQFNTPGGAPTDIKINFYNTDYPVIGGQEGLVFKIKDLMLLEGDYTTKIAPRYFWDTRGVGDKIKGSEQGDKKRELVVEARNKNLLNPAEIIDDFYLKTETVVDEQVTRWVQGSKGDSVSFLVYVKQGAHTLSVKAKQGMGRHLRFFVCGYGEKPTNGEPADKGNVYYKEDNSAGVDYISKKIDVNGNTNVLAIYIANLRHDPHDPGQTKPPHQEWSIKDVIEFMQLETGSVQTEPVPYKSIEKRFIIPRPLMNHDKLVWDDLGGEYVINNDIDPSVHESTGIKEEAFLHTFEDMTHIYVKNKIASIITAKFPIKIEGEHIYTKEEWAFEGETPGEIDQNRKNLLKLPNGFAMQWKNVTYDFGSGMRSREEDFLMLKNICFAMVQMAENPLDGENEGMYNFTTFKTEILGAQKNRVQIIRQYQGDKNGSEQQKYPHQIFRLRVLVFADLRDPSDM